MGNSVAKTRDGARLVKADAICESGVSVPVDTARVCGRLEAVKEHSRSDDYLEEERISLVVRPVVSVDLGEFQRQ